VLNRVDDRLRDLPRVQDADALVGDEPVAFLVSGQSDPAAARAELEATTEALAP